MTDATTTKPADDIAARAALADAGIIAAPGAPAGQAPTPEAAADQAKGDAISAAAAEFRGYLDAAVAMATEAGIAKIPELMPAERREKIAAAFGAVAVKRGWTMGDLFAKWREEAALVEACMPLIIYGGMLAWDAMKKKNAPARIVPADAPGAAPVVPAAPPPGEKRAPMVTINGAPMDEPKTPARKAPSKTARKK
jgi:hypothetical protein